MFTRTRIIIGLGLVAAATAVACPRPDERARPGRARSR